MSEWQKLGGAFGPAGSFDKAAMGELICGAYIAACHCEREPGHGGNHHCDCGGQWVGSDATGDAWPKKLPVRGSMPDPLRDLLDAAFGDPD